MQKPHVALLSSPGLGHLIPVIELGKILALHYNFKVTILAVTSQTSQAESHVLKSAISSVVNFCDFLDIPPADLSGLLENEAAVVERLCVVMRETKGAVRSVISNMTHLPSVLIVDIFGSECLSLAQEFGMLKYIYVASNAWFFSLLLYTPILDKQVQGQFVDQKEALEIPGCSPVRPEDVVDPMLDRNNRQYQEYVGVGMGMVKGDGILVNTWEQLQYRDLQSLRDENLLGGMLKVPVYAIGPLVRAPEPPTSSTVELLGWLDQQPSESVVYVSFGSGGTLSYEQTVEVACGLELSQLRFVWVVRRPNSGRADSAYFSIGDGRGRENDDVSNYLPEGFKERTHKVGKLVPQWAAQATILRHPSVGGFVSHCGWSSVLEGITNGVPMICWPLYAEQRMNATLLAEELKVGVKPKVLPAKKVVGREEIARMMRDIMEGEPNPIRERARELKESAAMAMKIGGSSFTALDDVAKQCNESLRHVHKQN
ncbi:hypothetical protein QN277_027790 [Acacia crassicarpa]|uniref:Glycosyltransferase n=1 Tax=Acacia crassicarpa TaxID=499986 RepID=A0AAE1K2J2_9FABA|nr:hypothetical protein QN277_027790 [Acacia crassicarpa]